jgi:lipoate---protein ligase
MTVKYLDLSLPTPAENLALDEALLDEAEQGGGPSEVLRLWEPLDPFVVVGRSSRLAVEVDLESCRADDTPVLRRCSGGAAVVTGPGCLMYAVVLSYTRRPALRSLEHAHCFVLSMMARALATLDSDVQIVGTSDLARRDRKFSGNSVRCRRDHLLYHGTVLYRFPLELIGRYLRTPPRQPDYRRQRDHDAFVANFPATADQLRRAIREAWGAHEELPAWPRQRTDALVAERYALADWNARL